jgi:uncharacterized protein YqeY
MSDSTIKLALNEAMKVAMRAKEKERLGVVRMALAAFKQVEVDERIEVDETRALQIIDKMVKQRRESVRQYQEAGREDLAQVETNEIAILQEFLPQALSEDEIESMIRDAISKTGASGIKDMSKIMAELRPHLQGRADIGAVSVLVKKLLN